MDLTSIVGKIEQPWRGNLNGIRVLVCGDSDEGKLSIKLARHSAAVVQLIADKTTYNIVAQAVPQALNYKLLLTNINEYQKICSTHFDLIVILEKHCNHTLPTSMGQNILKLKYNGNNDYIEMP